jgi:hypothetical protein
VREEGYIAKYISHSGISYSIYQLSYELDERGTGVRFPAEVKGFSLVHSTQTGCGTHPAFHPMDAEVLSLGVNKQLRKAAHSPPSSANVKNGEGISPFPHIHSWHGA